MTSTGVATVPKTDPHSSGRARLERIWLSFAVVLVSGPPIVIAAAYLFLSAGVHLFALDFEHAFWPAGQHVLHGSSPYPPVTRESLSTQTAFVYPPFAAVAMVPFALLPVHVAAGIFMALLVGCALAALWIVGVRDWRCYAAIFLWGPVLIALQTANVTLLLAFGAALAWRCRDRLGPAGVIIGLLVALKLFLWPLLVWLLATRRYGAALLAGATALTATAVAWATFGFAGVGEYLPMLRLLAKLDERGGAGPLAAMMKLGLSLRAGEALVLLLGGVMLGFILLVRRKHDAQSFVLALVAAILCSPVVWLHYYALFIVALAILQPRFSPLWVVPLVTLITPARPPGPTWWAVLVVATFAAVIATAVMRARGESLGRRAAWASTLGSADRPDRAASLP